MFDNLSGIRNPFHLVLDDYGFIHDPDIHYVLSCILEYVLPSLHLIVITRRDPPFNLTKLRGKGVLMEVRQADLQFSWNINCLTNSTTFGVLNGQSSLLDICWLEV